MSEKIYNLNNLASTLEHAQQLAQELKDSRESFVLLFHGGMGAGKTTFIRSFGQTLGIQEKITSPTFIGMNEYHLADLNFYHFDLYQVNPNLEDLSELISSNERKILAIEWAEKLEPNVYGLLARNLKVIKLEFKVVGDEERELSLSR